MAFSPNGDRFATGAKDGTVILWDSKSGQAICRFEGHNGSVNAIALSTSGNRVLTGSDDNTAILWDAGLQKTP